MGDLPIERLAAVDVGQTVDCYDEISFFLFPRAFRDPGGELHCQTLIPRELVSGIVTTRCVRERRKVNLGGVKTLARVLTFFSWGGKAGGKNVFFLLDP